MSAHRQAIVILVCAVLAGLAGCGDDRDNPRQVSPEEAKLLKEDLWPLENGYLCALGRTDQDGAITFVRVVFDLDALPKANALWDPKINVKEAVEELKAEGWDAPGVTVLTWSAYLLVKAAKDGEPTQGRLIEGIYTASAWHFFRIRAEGDKVYTSPVSQEEQRVIREHFYIRGPEGDIGLHFEDKPNFADWYAPERNNRLDASKTIYRVRIGGHEDPAREVPATVRWRGDLLLSPGLGLLAVGDFTTREAALAKKDRLSLVALVAPSRKLVLAMPDAMPEVVGLWPGPAQTQPSR